ncbi:hypothetical protein [Sporisorium scitamineum]|uniref:Cytochrome c oxidase polypeptide VIa n=1 Tax=Sporisorium scitamineum TaxID=49012 RepID=A0A0F7S300_9BASI|nr:hypothetical protein [Sporisorium scitamineum]
MASRFAAGLFGRSLTASVGRVQKAGAVRRLATAAGENEWVAERLHHKEHAGRIVRRPLAQGLALRLHSRFDRPGRIHLRHRKAPLQPHCSRYNNIRRKAFPWGDGSKSFFHNDMINYPASP